MTDQAEQELPRQVPAPTDETPAAKEKANSTPEENPTANNDSAASNADAPAPTKNPTDASESKPSLVGRITNLARRAGPLVGACLVSLAIGFSASWFLATSGKDLEEPDVEEAAIPKYVAAHSRRSEPIDPLVPFVGLDSEVVFLGKKLFHDPALSGNGRVSCATCHILTEGGDDNLASPITMKPNTGHRNTPTVFNAALSLAQFWDGRARSLEDQVDDPITSEDKMNSDWERITKYLTNEPSYAKAFRTHLNGNPSPELVKKALATYERSLIAVDSKFDHWLAGDESAIGTEALSGYYTFQKLNCVGCHQGTLVGGTMFQSIENLKPFFASKRELNDADLGRYNVTGAERDRFVFRVPSLRHAELTAPYFHDGSASTLEEAVDAMIRYQIGEEPNREEVRRIAIFLRTLTGTVPEN